MRSAASIREECKQAGYVGPKFHPMWVPHHPWLDALDPAVEQLGEHLGSAWPELRIDVGVHRWGRKRVGGRRNWERVVGTYPQLVPQSLMHAFLAIDKTWFKSTYKTGKRFTLGGAARFGLSRARRECDRVVSKLDLPFDPLRGHDALERDAVGSRDARSGTYYRLRIADPYYDGRSAERVALWKMDNDAICDGHGLTPVQHAIVLARRRGRTQAEIARWHGLDVNEVQRLLRQSERILQWKTASTGEDFPNGW